MPVRCAFAIGCVWMICGLGCRAAIDAEACNLAKPRQDFVLVSRMLGARCGSLDCHGQFGRPLRLYSERGLRLDPDALSGHGGTRSAEHEANLRAVAGLEPELTCAVFAADGGAAQSLSLVQKADGSELHKGGVVLPADSDGMRCLLSWLTGKVDAASCELAAMTERPE
jgi:hypothetical protein